MVARSCEVNYKKETSMYRRVDDEQTKTHVLRRLQKVNLTLNNLVYVDVAAEASKLAKDWNEMQVDVQI